MEGEKKGAEKLRKFRKTKGQRPLKVVWAHYMEEHREVGLDFLRLWESLCLNDVFHFLVMVNYKI